MLQFSLFSACAESEGNKVLEETEPVKILNRTTNEFQIELQKVDEPLFVFVSNAETVEFISQTDYTFRKLLDTLEFNKSNSGVPLKFVSDTTLNLLVKNLSPKTDYYISAFKSDSVKLYSVKISTLIQEPNEQALQIVNTASTDTSVSIRWTNGNGQNRIVVIRKDMEPENPNDGKKYKVTTKYGVQSSEYGNGNFVVFDSEINKGNEITIENLKYGNYYVKVFEYNGEDDYANYFTENSRMNPVIVQPLLPPPVNLSFDFTAGDTFVVKWDRLDDTTKYELQIAHDKEFNNIIKRYDGLMIGNANLWEIPVNSISNNVCYYRVRAIQGSKKSMYSNPQEVKFK
jgi:hypothetical protein